VAGESVQVDWNKRDWYKRIVGKIIHEGKDINLKMIRAGLAWWYRKYANEQNAGDRVLYEAAEKGAREERRGLWAVGRSSAGGALGVAETEIKSPPQQRRGGTSYAPAVTH